jgi:hypothetical protein
LYFYIHLFILKIHAKLNLISYDGFFKVYKVFPIYIHFYKLYTSF